jgi:NADH dehydrogenase (ubiquinone) Fe-S protein 8
MSSTINMSFARHTPLGLSTRLSLSPATGTPSISLVGLRHFAASRRTLQAQPAHESANHLRSPRLGTGVYSARDELDKYVNPYEGGPSALEKAAHIFFFTEIVRGSFMFTVQVLSSVSDLALSPHHPRNVASLGTVLPSSIYDHVSF